MAEATRILVLPLFYLCDARCSMCNIWQQSGVPRLEPDELRRVLSDHALADYVQVVNVTGGEPTLRKDLLEIVQAIVQSLKALHTISLQTHGLNPRLVEARIGPIVAWLRDLSQATRPIHIDVNISLDGPDGIHDGVRGREGAFSAVIESIQIVREMLAGLAHSSLLLNCTIVQQNVAHLRETQRVADELGIEITYTVPQETDTYMTNVATAEQFRLSRAQRLEASCFLREILDGTRGRTAMSRRYCEMLIGLLETGKRNIDCPLTEGGMFMDPDGQAFPCWRSSTLQLGNWREDTMASMLEARAKPAYREKLQAFCDDCPSNCYVDWTRRMFARRLARGSAKTHDVP